MTNHPFDANQTAGTARGTNQEVGAKAKKESLLFGIIGLFFLGIVCGPLALMRAKEAERHGVKATAGKILGWIDIVFGAFAIVGLILNFA